MILFPYLHYPSSFTDKRHSTQHHVPVYKNTLCVSLPTLCFLTYTTLLLAQMIDTARNIIAVNITYPVSISEMAKSFISSCFKKHPGDRPTVVEMLHHPWIRMFQVRGGKKCRIYTHAHPCRGANNTVYICGYGQPYVYRVHMVSGCE